MPFNPTVPTWLALNSCNFDTETGLSDLRTGQAVYGGALVLGDYFDLTEREANQLSYLTNGTLHAGRYRLVQVDSGATASNVKTGTVGLMVAGGQPNLNLVTSYDKGIQGCHQVVFLNSITPGKFGFVQELGVANMLCGATITKSGPASGDMINATTLGVVDDPTAQTTVINSIGLALDPPSPNTKIRVIMNYVPVLQG